MNETPMTVEFASKISPIFNKRSETKELEYYKLGADSCLDL